jgi:hypothetical protein
MIEGGTAEVDDALPPAVAAARARPGLERQGSRGRAVEEGERRQRKDLQNLLVERSPPACVAKLLLQAAAGRNRNRGRDGRADTSPAAVRLRP